MNQGTGSPMPMAEIRNALHERVINDVGYHKATEETGPMHDDVRARCSELTHWLVDNVPLGREQQLTLTNLQQAQMWANAAVACNLSPLA